MSATFTVTLNARALKAAAMCASNEETRYYLKGVFVETSAAGVTLTATDGHRLVAMNHTPAVDLPHDANAPAVIVPLHMIDKLKIGKRAPDYATLGIDASAGSSTLKLTLSYDGLSVCGDAIDGTYPAARRVAAPAFNSPDAGKIAHFNPAYVATFGKMCELMTGVKPPAIYIGHNGDNPALVDFLGDRDAGGVDAFGILMPCRLHRDSGRASSFEGLGVPAWYDPNPAPAPAADAAPEGSQAA